MIDDRRANMPFSIIAVAILLMATVAGAVAAEHSRVSEETASVEDGISELESSVDRIGSYLDRELGILILDISKDGSLGTLDDRAEEFEARAGTWLDSQFPIREGDVTARLIEYDLQLTAESMGIVSGNGNVDGFTPAYLHGAGTVKVEVRSEFGGSVRDIPISTDGSYALPLASERCSIFERMVEGNGVTVSQMVSYQLESLAQYRILNGYGSRFQYGETGTASIITSADVLEAYNNALDLMRTVCFRDGSGDERCVDLADLMVGDEIVIDRAAFYGQVLMSSADDAVLKWYDYLCGDLILDDFNWEMFISRTLLDATVDFFRGDEVLGGGAYVQRVMEDNGVEPSVYRTPGSGRTIICLDGFTVTVDNPVEDVLEQGWMKRFKGLNNDRNYIQDMMRQVLNTAAVRVQGQDYPPLVVKVDPHDTRTLCDDILEAFTELTAESGDVIGSALADASDSTVYYDQFYGALAEMVLSHAEDFVLEDELLDRIYLALCEQAGDEAEELMWSEEVQRALHAYRSKVYSDLSVYDTLRSVEGRGPGILQQILITIATYGFDRSGLESVMEETSLRVLEEFSSNIATNPYSRLQELSTSDGFLLVDGEDNYSRECLEMTFTSDPIVAEPIVLRNKCTHVTGFMEDVCAGYSTTFLVRLWDTIDYRVEGHNPLSKAMDGSGTSSVTGSVTECLEIEISVASAWALIGVEYSASNTIFGDAWETLSVYLEPILGPLREIISMIRDFIDVVNGCIMEIARYVSGIIAELYERIMGPINEIAEWIQSELARLVGEGVLDMFYSLDLSGQRIGFEYLGYTFTMDFNLASLASPVKTLFTATLAGPVAGMDLVASVTAKIKGEMNANNLFLTGKATVTAQDWKVKMTVDPLMKSSKHLLTISADIRKTDITLVMPELEDYHEIGFTLSKVPGVGEMLQSIPVPFLGVNIGLDAGVSIKYTAPTAEGLIINEFESNPKGDDIGNEWVELLNNSDKSIALDGYTLSASSDRTKKMTLSGTISPGEFLIVNPTFLLVNTSGKLTKNGECLTLKDPDGVIVDKTGTYKDGGDDGKTWQRTYDGAGEWEFKDGSMGRSNGSYASTKLMSVEIAKEIVSGAVEDAFDEIGPITDMECLEEIVKLTVKYSVDRVIKKVAGCLVEASVFVKVDVLDPTSSVSTGIRIALRCDSELAEDVLKYIAGKVEEMVLSMKNPYRIDGVAAFTDNIDLEVTFHTGIQYPRLLARSLEDTPKVDLGITFRTNISALTRVYGKEIGTPSMECGLRVIDCPLSIIPPTMSPKKGLDHDLWLFKMVVEW